MNRLLIGMVPAERCRPLRGLFTCGCLVVLSLFLPAAARAQDKPANEQGHYLHPDLFGEPEEKSILHARYPNLRRQVLPQKSDRAS